MPISNYQTPGVYVTQAQQIQVSPQNNALNIAFFGYVPSGNYPTAPQTDTFLVTSSGFQTFNLTQSGAIVPTTDFLSNTNTGFVYTASGTSTTVPAGYYSVPVTVSGVTSFTVSGFTVNSYITANYTFTTAQPGVLYTFNNYNQVQQTFGPAFNYNGTSTTIASPNTLAAYLAFLNGARQVSCMNILAVSGGSEADFMTAIYSTQSTPGIDVIVPLKYDSAYNVSDPGQGQLFYNLSSYLTAQANLGNYMRSFIGLDSTVGQTTSLLTTCANIDTQLSNSRVSLVAPQTFIYAPGQNATNGNVAGTMTINGYYMAAAVAGLFTGQSSVAVPLTNKYANGFVSIPNQISSADSNTLQSYGTLVVRQDRNSNILVRQGLTTDITNWLTQEVSIGAIGDQLVKSIVGAVNNSGLIGSPLTPTIYSTVTSVIQTVLNSALQSNLIQSWTNYQQTPNQSNPTEIDVTFQYAPTIPLNYINVVFSINSQTGVVTSNVTA